MNIEAQADDVVRAQKAKRQKMETSAGDALPAADQEELRKAAFDPKTDDPRITAAAAKPTA